MLKDKFTAFFKPFQKVIINEPLVLFWRQLHFVQNIPSKMHHFGLKFYTNPSIYNWVTFVKTQL